LYPQQGTTLEQLMSSQLSPVFSPQLFSLLMIKQILQKQESLYQFSHGGWVDMDIIENINYWWYFDNKNNFEVARKTMNLM
jgi:hypothetical protein